MPIPANQLLHDPGELFLPPPEDAARLLRRGQASGAVADRIEGTPPDRKIGGRLGDTGGTYGVFALVDDNPVWQRAMRAQLDAEQG